MSKIFNVEECTLGNDQKRKKEEEEEERIRDNECANCRFVPCGRPKKESHDGESSIFRHRFCPDSDKNPFLHSKWFYDGFGEFGLHFFDLHRNFFFGFASVCSLIGICCLIYGTSAITDRQSVISQTYWAKLDATNVTTNDEFSLRLGLTAMVMFKGSGKPAILMPFGGNECYSNRLFGAVCAECSKAAKTQSQGPEVVPLNTAVNK